MSLLASSQRCNSLCFHHNVVVVFHSWTLEDCFSVAWNILAPEVRQYSEAQHNLWKWIRDFAIPKQQHTDKLQLTILLYRRNVQH